MSLKRLLIPIAAVLALAITVAAPALAAETKPHRYSGTLLVTGVAAPNVNTTSAEDLPVTVKTTDQTVFWKAGARAALSDVAAGQRIRVRGQVLQPGVIEAVGIQILPVQRAGQVTAVSGSTITIKGRDEDGEQTWSVVVSSSTVYQPVLAGLSLQNVVVGARLRASGFLDAQGSLAATHAWIAPSRVGGKVTAVQGNTITLETKVNGQTQTATVAVGQNTRYLKGKDRASLSDVTVGSQIDAAGYKDQSGTLNAALVHIRVPKPAPAAPATPAAPTPTPAPTS